MNTLLIVPEPVYILLLLASWFAATFIGIAFVYSVHMKRVKHTVMKWGGVFVLCLLLVFLLMSGVITAS